MKFFFLILAIALPSVLSCYDFSKDLNEIKEMSEAKLAEKQQEILAEIEKVKETSSKKPENSIMVFASFSMPDTLWVSLSKELEKQEGAFVLRGIPNNSFPDLAKKILALREKGVFAPILLDPIKFKDYEISKVPTIVQIKEDGFDKISGTVSLHYALNLFRGAL